MSKRNFFIIFWRSSFEFFPNVFSTLWFRFCKFFPKWFKIKLMKNPMEIFWKQRFSHSSHSLLESFISLFLSFGLLLGFLDLLNFWCWTNFQVKVRTMFSMLGNNLKLRLIYIVQMRNFYLDGICSSSMKFWTFECELINHCLEQFSIQCFTSDIWWCWCPTLMLKDI